MNLREYRQWEDFLFGGLRPPHKKKLHPKMELPNNGGKKTHSYKIRLANKLKLPYKIKLPKNMRLPFKLRLPYK